MPKDKKCKCPLCEQTFSPESGLTPQEHIAKGVIQVFGKIQTEQHVGDLYCPRCGRVKMKPMLAQNSISRYIDVYICEDCGADEGERELKLKALPLTDWHIVYEIMKYVVGLKCRNYIPEKDNPYPLCDNTACKESATCSISAHMSEEGIY